MSGSATKYFLWLAALGPNPRVPLSAKEYRDLQGAWDTIIGLLPFEEGFDGVLHNYIELESTFVETALNSMVLGHNNSVELRKVRLTFARRLSNLLSSCRSYLDRSPHHLKALSETHSESFVKATNEAYDREFAYRFMEALRNYAQHRGSPLHSTSFNSGRVERESEKAFLQYSVGASINVEELRNDRAFKRVIADELSGWERVDVIAMCRIYVESLAEIHATIRKELEDRVDQSKTLLRAAIDRYEAVSDSGRVGIAIAKSRDERSVDHYQNIPEDVIELYENLVQQNRRLVNLRNRFVTSEILPERKAGTRFN
jgi:hypothetical protein